MSGKDSIVHLLKNVPVRDIIKALERDNFLLKKSTKTGGHIYLHPDGRIVVIHYHHGSDTFKRKTLKVSSMVSCGQKKTLEN